MYKSAVNLYFYYTLSILYILLSTAAAGNMSKKIYRPIKDSTAKLNIHKKAPLKKMMVIVKLRARPNRLNLASSIPVASLCLGLLMRIHIKKLIRLINPKLIE
jgi:hypothetical protein